MYNLLKAGGIMSHGTSITILGAPTLALQPSEPGADNVINNAQLYVYSDKKNIVCVRRKLNFTCEDV